MTRSLEHSSTRNNETDSTRSADFFFEAFPPDNKGVISSRQETIDQEWARLNDPGVGWPELGKVRQEREQARERFGSRLRRFGRSVVNYFRSSPEAPRQDGEAYMTTEVSPKSSLSLREHVLDQGVIGGMNRPVFEQSSELSSLRQEAYMGVIGESLTSPQEKTHAATARQAREGGVIGASPRYTIPRGRHEASFQDEINNHNGVLGA